MQQCSYRCMCACKLQRWEVLHFLHGGTPGHKTNCSVTQDEHVVFVQKAKTSKVIESYPSRASIIETFPHREHQTGSRGLQTTEYSL